MCYGIRVSRFGCLVILVACSHAATPVTPVRIASNRAPAPVYAGAAFKAVAADPLAFLPSDADVVLSVDVEAVRKSFVWPAVSRFLHGEMGGAYDTFVDACGFDPVRALRRFTIAGSHLTEDTGSSVSVATGISRRELLHCMEHAQFMQAWKYTTANGVTVATHATEKGSFAVTFLDETTSVWSLGKNHSSPAALDIVLRSGAPLRKSPAFIALFAQLDTRAPLWILVNGESTLGTLLSPATTQLKVAAGTIRLEDGINIHGRAMFDPAGSAQTLLPIAQATASFATTKFDHLDFTVDGESLVLDALMSNAKFTALTNRGSIFAPTP